MRFSVVELVDSVKRAYWASQGLKSRLIELGNGSTMHCWIQTCVSSAHKPAVVLVHGFGADGLTGWEKQIGALGKHFDLYIPDLLFFGESTTSSSERSEIFQAECVKSMLECLQVKRVMVVGHSYGGFVGFWMAHRFPELVRCLVIVSSGVCMTPSSNDDLLNDLGATDIRDVLLPQNVHDFKRCINHTIYKMPWLPTFIYKDFMESKGGRRNERAQLIDAIVIGSKNAHSLPTLIQGLKSRRIELGNGSTMHCWIKTCGSSADKPAVVLVHGFGADGLSGWEKQIGVLGKHFDLYIPDLLFFGESTTSSSERSEIFQAECVKSMLECLQVKRVMVVGHSYGGFVGFWMAHRFPELVRCLVIVSSAVCSTPSSNDDLLNELGATDIRDVLLPQNVHDFKRCINLSIYKMPWLPTFIYKDLIESKGGRRNERVQLVDAIVIGSKNAHPLPTPIQEVLIIWGKNDKIFKLQEAHAIQRHIGEKAKLVVIEECGHVPSFEKPTKLNEELLKFLLDIERSQQK